MNFFKKVMYKSIPQRDVDERLLNKLIDHKVKEIKLDMNIHLNETINIDFDDIVIDGDGHAIDGGGKTQIFNISSNNVTLKNINFQGSFAGRSGGAIFNHCGNLNIIDCNFIDNRAFNGNGGAIYNKEGFLNICGCGFEGNGARFGGAIYNGNSLNISMSNFSSNQSSKGLAIFNSSNASITLKKCSFKKQHAQISGPEIYNVGIVHIDESQKQEIQNVVYGGFVHVSKKSFKTINDLAFEIQSCENGIRLNSDFELDRGFVIEHDGLEIDGNGHTIDACGTASIFNVKADNVTLKNINFTNASAGIGAAINNEGRNLSLVNCTFKYNIANKGGAVNNNGSIYIIYCNFLNNIANVDFGGAINNNGDLEVSNSNFILNTSENHGGAISNSKNLIIKNSRFESNFAENGASVNNVENANVKIIKSDFEDNKASIEGSIIYNSGQAEICRCTSSNNVSNRFTNIIFQTGDETCELTIEGCEFSRDIFNDNLIYFENGSSLIKSTKFTLNEDNNHDDYYVIYNKNAYVELKEIEFENVVGECIFNEGEIKTRKGEGIEKYIKSN